MMPSFIHLRFQPLGCSFDSTASGNHAVFDYYDGMDTYYYLNDVSKYYMIVPRIDTMTCFETDTATTPLPTMLPNLTGWTYRLILNLIFSDYFVVGSFQSTNNNSFNGNIMSPILVSKIIIRCWSTLPPLENPLSLTD